MTTEADDPWALLDDLMGVRRRSSAPAAGGGRLAFYGRCSTEDNQDPETSRAWQLSNAAKFVEPAGGQVVAEFFDIGQSRSVPWDRRDQARLLLAELRDPHRGWTGVVVGEGTRCWFGNQFSLVAPRLAAYGVSLWVPELGGRFDDRNPSHKMLMSLLGGMSESERQHVQARVRSAMDVQVVNEGRHQGGRPPYGYRVVDAGPHPNPRKSAEGYRLRVLELDPAAATVVRRIFNEYLEGFGDRAIANGLNRDGEPCPSAVRPEQNRHRQGDGWQAGTVRAILGNPRYTGYAVFGRWVKHEVLLDPDDPAAGHVTRFKPSDPSRIVRSRSQAHEPIVSVEDFTRAQVVRRGKSAAGLASMGRLPRGRRTSKRVYALRGLVVCSVCDRRMEGAAVKDRVYYRCRSRTLVPGSPLLARHPRTVSLREARVLGPLNGWIAGVLAPSRIDRTMKMLTEMSSRPSDELESVRARCAEADARVRRLQEAITAGVDPAALVDALNGAHAERVEARAALDAVSTSRPPNSMLLREAVATLGDVGRSLTACADAADLNDLYEALQVQLRYDPDDQVVHAAIRPRVVSTCVRGGT